jgi:8-oxo-dGTP pyrophosphatase MutT (NUDIX family)
VSVSERGDQPSGLARSPESPRAASTVVLLRDGTGSADREARGIEVFLVQRHGSMGFMGGMHVFPGGKVADADTRAALGARTADAECVATHRWGDDVDDETAFARAAAAIRETFEEAGVLLCAQPLGPIAARERARLLAGTAFADVLDALAVQLQVGALQPLSRWITPESEPVRFDTSFYLARAPGDQVAEHDHRESVAALWVSPGDALARAESGAIRLAPPTARTLEGLAEEPSVDSALQRAAQRSPPLVMPVIRTVGDEVMIFYPGDPEHPVAERALPGPTRRVMRRLGR